MPENIFLKIMNSYIKIVLYSSWALLDEHREYNCNIRSNNPSSTNWLLGTLHSCEGHGRASNEDRSLLFSAKLIEQLMGELLPQQSEILMTTAKIANSLFRQFKPHKLVCCHL